MATLNPYLTFAGTAREAMEFYQSVLGGDLKINTFAEFGDTGNDGVMHARLETPEGFTLMADDEHPDMPRTSPSGSAISISLSGPESDLLRGYWDKLSEGARVTTPLEKQMWGDEFGMLTERFGTAWMVNILGADSDESVTNSTGTGDASSRRMRERPVTRDG